MWSQSTNVTDRRTDGRTTCDRKTALCTKVHCAVKIRRCSLVWRFLSREPKRITARTLNSQNLISKTTILALHFPADIWCMHMHLFHAVVCETHSVHGRDTSVRKQNLTQNGHSIRHSWSSTSLSANTVMRVYILQCNRFGLVCERSEDIATEKKRRSPFLTTLLSFNVPYAANSRDIRINLILSVATNWSSCDIFCRR